MKRPTVTDTYASAFAQLGGIARAAQLSKARKSEIGQIAAKARWFGHVRKNKPRSKRKA